MNTRSNGSTPADAGKPERSSAASRSSRSSRSSGSTGSSGASAPATKRAASTRTPRAAPGTRTPSTRARRTAKDDATAPDLPRADAAPVDVRLAMTDDARRALVAEIAYLRAEKRHFAPGGEVEDWLAAEAEVARRMGER